MSNIKMTELEAMKECLIEYYEAAGFDNVDNRMLEGRTDKEIEYLYNQINEDMANF